MFCSAAPLGAAGAGRDLVFSCLFEEALECRRRRLRHLSALTDAPWICFVRRPPRVQEVRAEIFSDVKWSRRVQETHNAVVSSSRDRLGKQFVIPIVSLPLLAFLNESFSSAGTCFVLLSWSARPVHHIA